jgi:hypothetical protein
VAFEACTEKRLPDQGDCHKAEELETFAAASKEQTHRLEAGATNTLADRI